MIGPRLTSVFKSRWMALLWGGMVVWTAIDFVGTAPSPANHSGNSAAASDADDQPISNEDAAALKKILDGK
ncbi:MAG TPA: hypothetical protein VF503_23550 [Sphingobium sp.]|uniref:hypothetical protein n=1 Tax=Sphingobium sp. TaxID=1912891 RepID=UPI002ECFF929